ncbi:hypothetical protein BDFB_014232 [Asbolus verrucosus]|uniref:Uncharacterized protein n=1 Tax=Asbolus verrucosus TaxID=1661398 RepID=A0A482W7T3_ASBVE|nr:hypothetical protein BDFB_014232 [Asbolus verrucosus]
MSVFQGLTIVGEGHQEAEVWVAVLKHAIAIDSNDPYYDGYFYEDTVKIQNPVLNYTLNYLPPFTAVT